MYEEYMEDMYQKRVNEKGLEIISSLYLFTEIFEFAIRLAQGKILGDEITIRIKCYGIKGRQLFFYEGTRTLFRDYISTIEDEAHLEINVGVEELISNGNTIAIEVLNNLFEKFNWDIHAIQGVFIEEQQKLLKGLT